MRLIGTFKNEDELRRFALFLKTKGIETSTDGSFDPASGHMSYQLWGSEEDQITDGQKEFEAYMKNPKNPLYNCPPPKSPLASPGDVERNRQVTSSNPFTPFTAFIIALCVFIFLLNLSEEISPQKEKAPSFFTQVQLALFYDLPPPIESIQNLLDEKTFNPDQKQATHLMLSEIRSLEQTPYFRGLYDWLLVRIREGDSDQAEGTMFGKIRQGEVWRLFSPAVLHVGLLHLLFNMIWAWILARPIEEKVGVFPLFLILSIVGIGSNTAQYLMGGPFFLGFSGVVMGLAAFIWMREKRAPWEGYPVQKSTLWFLMIYVGAMALIQVGSFVMQMSMGSSFSPNIANTAHISGGLIGALLGRMSFFAQRVTR